MNEYNANGERHGPWESYHKNGQLMSKRNYVNGLYHGSFESYYRDGQLCSKGGYQNNQEVGFWLYGSPSGKMFKHFYL